MRLFVYTLYIGYTLGRRRDTKRMPFRYAVRHVLVGVYIVSHVLQTYLYDRYNTLAW